MIRNRRARRSTVIALLIAGGVLIWLAPETYPGVTLLVLGIVLEIVGIAIEHRDKP